MKKNNLLKLLGIFIALWALSNTTGCRKDEKKEEKKQEQVQKTSSTQKLDQEQFIRKSFNYLPKDFNYVSFGHWPELKNSKLMEFSEKLMKMMPAATSNPALNDMKLYEGTQYYSGGGKIPPISELTENPNFQKDPYSIKIDALVVMLPSESPEKWLETAKKNLTGEWKEENYEGTKLLVVPNFLSYRLFFQDGFIIMGPQKSVHRSLDIIQKNQPNFSKNESLMSLLKKVDQKKPAWAAIDLDLGKEIQPGLSKIPITVDMMLTKGLNMNINAELDSPATPNMIATMFNGPMVKNSPEIQKNALAKKFIDSLKIEAQDKNLILKIDIDDQTLDELYQFMENSPEFKKALSQQ